MKHKLGLIGCGVLGGIISEKTSFILKDDYEFIGVVNRDFNKAEDFSKNLNCKACENIDELIKLRPDYIIEAASTNCLKDVAVKILENGINLIVLSVGAFADSDFYNICKKTAKGNKSRIYIASGAVGGFDVLKTATLIEETQVSIETKKAPASLNGAPCLNGRNLSETETEEVFNGTAANAISAFPKNINVAVATALATTGCENTKVIIKSVPGMKSNLHCINLVGETVKVKVEIESKPSKENPKSSTLAALSVVSLLEKLSSPIVF